MQRSHDATSNNLYARSVRGGAWYGLNVATQKAVTLVGFLILARFLGPESYGVIAAIFVVVGLLEQATTIPFGDALVQRKEDVERYLDPMWTWDLLRGIILTAILFFTAPAFAAYFKLDASATELLRFGALFILIPLFGNPRQIYFFRHLDLRRVFIRDTASQAAFVLGAVLYAVFVSGTATALFVGHVARYTVGVLMSYVLYPAWPRISFAFGRLKELLGFGKWVYGQQVMDYAVSMADKALVGGIMDVERLGIYARSRDVSLMASSSIASLFDKIGMATYARIQDDLTKVRHGFLKSLDVLAMTAVPFSLLLLFEGGALVAALLGEKWIAITLPLKIFSFGAVAVGMTYALRPMFTALGRPDITFRLNLFQTLLALPLMYVAGVSYGPIGLAVAVVATWIATLVAAAWTARPILRFDKSDVGTVFWPTAWASLVTFALDIVGRGAIHHLSSTWADLAWAACLGMMYFSVLFWTSCRARRGPFETFRSVCGQVWQGIRSRG